MKKIAVFLIFIITIFWFAGKIRQDEISKCLNYVFGQSSAYSLYAKDCDNKNRTMEDNSKEKYLYSYNPPKAYLGISIVSTITFFVIYKKYRFHSVVAELRV